MDFDPAAPDLPLLPHPFAPVRDLDPGTVDGDDDILGKDLGCSVEREIQEVDPAEEGGVVGCLKRGSQLPPANAGGLQRGSHGDHDDAI